MPKGECWLYAGLVHPSNGYGLIWDKGLQKIVLAHRAMYEALVALIPKELQVDHLCRVRSCINPDHMEPVTMMENLRRSPLWYGNKTHCKNGHEFTEANIYRRKDCPQRGCRTCRYEAVKRQTARKRG